MKILVSAPFMRLAENLVFYRSQKIIWEDRLDSLLSRTLNPTQLSSSREVECSIIIIGEIEAASATCVYQLLPCSGVMQLTLVVDA